MTDEYDNRFGQMISGLNSTLDSIESELEETVKGYSPDKLLSLGKNALRNSSYISAELLFDKLGEFSQFREIASLYEGLASTISDCEIATQLERSYHGPRNTSCSCSPEKIIQNTINFMKESSTMYVEKTISAEELLEIELYIDRIFSNDVEIKDKEEFNRIYSKFKEYCLDVFLEIQ